MKTRLLIIIVIILLVVSITYVSFAYNQEIRLATGMMMAEAAPNENPNDKAKNKAQDRSDRKAPNPLEPHEIDSTTKLESDPNKIVKIPSENYPKRSDSSPSDGGAVYIPDKMYDANENTTCWMKKENIKASI